MIVVDTSVWTDWFAGRSTPQTRLLTLLVEDDASIALADVGLTEILQGLRTERHGPDSPPTSRRPRKFG